MDRTFMRRRYIMKMHEIIKKRRLALNLTQEQVAKYLGVTTPAVISGKKEFRIQISHYCQHLLDY